MTPSVVCPRCGNQIPLSDGIGPAGSKRFFCDCGEVIEPRSEGEEAAADEGPGG